MTVSDIRRCYHSGWCVEFVYNSDVWDFEFVTERDADRFFLLLQSIKNYKDAWQK